MELSTRTLADVYDGLTAPFTMEVIELKPGALTNTLAKIGIKSSFRLADRFWQGFGSPPSKPVPRNPVAV